jgi:benzoate-CoA ligase family protein
MAALAKEIGFSVPANYNASRLLWDNLATNNQRQAILSDNGNFTYGQLAVEAAKIGNALLQAGCKPRDRILLFLNDEPAYPAAIMGALRAGFVPVLINTLTPSDLIQYCLEDSKATAAVVSKDHAELFTREAITGTECHTVIVSAATQPWAMMESELAEYPTTAADMAFWMYSSGSTGKPKGVVHQHEDALYTAWSYARHILKINQNDVCFSVPKIFFAYGFGNSITFPMSVGAASVLMAARPDPTRIYEHIDRYRPTLFFGLPTLYNALIRAESAKQANLSSVRLCVSAAEILSKELSKAWRDQFGHAIVEGLGSTELLHIYLSNTEQQQKSGSAGKPVPGYSVRLETSDGLEALKGEEGVMAVRGLSGATHYWNRPKNTAKTMRNGWIYTGDRFICDQEGFYFFKGRADDLIKVSGQWVYPLEIELALNEHPMVAASCVQALELADKRFTIIAWVVLAVGIAQHTKIEQALQNHTKRMLLPHKYPREIIVLHELPKTGTGKIDRQLLKAGYGEPNLQSTD